MRLTALRHALLIAFFVTLVGIEVAHGLFRIDVIRSRQREEVLARTSREISELATRLRAFLDAGEDHVAYLARSPGVRALLDARVESDRSKARADLESWTLPYLVAFNGIDRVRVLASDGSERFRCERIGGGVGAIPPALLLGPPEVDSSPPWRRTLRPGEVAVSDLVADLERVEVPREDRHVLHYSTAVSSGATPEGIVVATIYASPILEAVRRFAPVEGSWSMLVDDEGRYLAHVDRSRESRADLTKRLEKDFPETAGSSITRSERLDIERGALLSATVREAPGWHVVTFVPTATGELTAPNLGPDYFWGIASTVLITGALAAAAVFFVRLSVRSVRLEEARRKEELEKKLALSERLSSLGLLTAGVAHEINNPLEGMGNYLALLDRDELDDETRRRYVERLRGGVRRIRDIVRDLRAFAKPPSPSQAARLEQVVRDSLAMLQYSRDFHGVSVDVVGLDDLPLIAGDAGRLEQVFINLLHNACRAVDGSGEVRITGRLEPRRANEPARVEVRIEDDGPGFPPGVLERIFDPFFTTSADGTGLGLWISYGILRAHDGTLEADNRPGGGAVLTLRLPVAESRQDTARPPDAE